MRFILYHALSCTHVAITTPAPPLPSPFPPSPPPSSTPPLQNSDLSFVPGKNKGSSNAILAGHRYCLDRNRGEKEYWKCTYFKDGCRARIQTEGRQLMTLTAPSHSHDIQHSEILVHVTKQNLKRKAVESDTYPRDVVLDSTESTDHLRNKEIAKMGCKISSLASMVRKSKSGCPRLPLLSYHPTRPFRRSQLPSDIYWGTSSPVGQWILHCKTPLLLVFGTPANVATLQEADHLVIDGTFKSCPDGSSFVHFFLLTSPLLSPTLSTPGLSDPTPAPPLFAIPSWNQHDASLMRQPRSTNIAEGWHHGFNSMLSCNHPTIWRFLEALKKEQNLTRM